MKYGEALERLIGLLRLYQRPGDGTTGALGRHLSRAEPYYWASGPCSLVATGAKSLRGWTLYPNSLPSTSGFMWFERPFADFEHPQCGALLAQSWCYPSIFARRLPDSPVDSIDLTSWFYWLPHDISLPVPGLVTTWPIGSSMESIKTLVRTLNQDGEEIEAAPEDAVIRELAVDVFASSMAFLSQRILVTRPERPDRAARRRLEREGVPHDPVVRVVELRRKEARDRPESDGDPVDWHCRWLVSGHWRQQWYPSVQRHQPAWISPYVKGPEDMPLKEPSAKVFAVVR